MPAGTLSLASSRALHAAAARSRALARERRERLRRHGDQDFGALGRDQVADDAGEPGRAVVLARETDRDADREQQAEVREDRLARRREDRRCRAGRAGRVAAAGRRSAAPRSAASARGRVAAPPRSRASRDHRRCVSIRSAFRVAQQRAHFRRRSKRERLLRRAPGSSRASMPRTCALMRGMAPGTTDSSLHAEAEQDGHARADPTRGRRTLRRAGRATAAASSGYRDQAQHRRMQSVELRRELGMRRGPWPACTA